MGQGLGCGADRDRGAEVKSRAGSPPSSRRTSTQKNRDKRRRKADRNLKFDRALSDWTEAQALAQKIVGEFGLSQHTGRLVRLSEISSFGGTSRHSYDDDDRVATPKKGNER